MRVVVTRPRPAAERTAAKLEQLGHQPVLLPLLAAEHVPGAFAALPPPETTALVVTSAEALRALAAESLEAQRPYLALPLYAVGERTAETARQLGFETVVTGPGDGRSLGAVILADLCERPAALLYLAGTPRSPDLEDALGKAGQHVTVRECYRMVTANVDEATIAALTGQPPDVVLLYSSETARRFVELVGITQSSDTWQDTRFLCLSGKIASVLPDRYQANASWPAAPREETLLELLKDRER